MFRGLLITVRWFWFVISGSGQTVSRGSDSRHVWEDLHSHRHESVRLQQALPPPATKIHGGKVRLVTYTSNKNKWNIIQFWKFSMFYTNIRLYKEFSAYCFTQHQFNLFHCVILDFFFIPTWLFCNFFYTVKSNWTVNMDVIFLFCFSLFVPRELNEEALLLLLVAEAIVSMT